MRIAVAMATVLAAAACATTYNMPVEERSRSFDASQDAVWDAAIGALDELDITVVQAERENGWILARAKGSIWDWKGHLVRVTVTDVGGGHVRVEANAESVSDDSVIDFGRARGLVRIILIL